MSGYYIYSYYMYNNNLIPVLVHPVVPLSAPGFFQAAGVRIVVPIAGW